jgi:hypothetical protein
VAPSVFALKRNRDGKEWTRLPAHGRLAEAPEWPDEAPPARDNEIVLWRRLWTLPQAIVWEADHSHDMVALYVRTFLEAMQHRAGAHARTFTKQLAGELLLTPSALAQGRYVIQGTDEDKAIQDALSGGADRAGVATRSGGRDRGVVVRIVPPITDEQAEQIPAMDDEPDDDEEIPF